MSNTEEDGLTQLWDRLPRRLRVTVVTVVVVVVAFSATVLPFIASNRATTSVEVAGYLPTSATVGEPVSFDIAADNTGNANVSPLCIKLTAAPPVTDLSAVFQGLDHVEGSGGTVCGGTLSGSETVSIHLTLTLASPGDQTMRIVAAQGKSEIGPARTVHVLVEGKPAA